MANNFISIVIPTYHEKENISPLLTEIHRAFTSQNYEIIIVDDNSRDGTAEIVAELANQYPVRIIVRRRERGLATAVMAGIAAARGDIIGVMDADLQHPPEIMSRLTAEIERGAAIAIASRYVTGGSCQGWGLMRRVISKAAIFLAHLTLPATRGVNDPVSGFFAFRGKILKGITLNPSGYKILLEILVRSEAAPVSEVPFHFRLRHAGESKLDAGQQKAYLRHLLRLMRDKGEFRRIIRFGLVGLSGVGVNMGLLWLLTEFGNLDYRLASIISIETAIISNFTLNDFFTFPDRRRSRHSFAGRLGRFNLISLVGLGINWLVLWLFTESLGLYYLLSNLVGIALATVWNYFGNSWWTWRR